MFGSDTRSMEGGSSDNEGEGAKAGPSSKSEDGEAARCRFVGRGLTSSWLAGRIVAELMVVGSQQGLLTCLSHKARSR